MTTDPFPLINQLNITDLSKQQIEIIVAQLSFTELVALEERDDEIIVYHEELSELKKLVNHLMKQTPWLSFDKINYSTQRKVNWNKDWESSFKPIQIDDYCLIKASFHNIESETFHQIIIDPKMAFGTGHHETTFLMIQMMRKLEMSNKDVLDYGTGTGVLAILAEKEGASSILAIDHDPIATECARSSIAKNDCFKINVQTAELKDINQVTFEIILANINRNVILSHAEDLAHLQRKGGELVLSGFMISDYRGIIDRFNQLDYTLTNRMEKGEWLSLRLTKN